MGSVKSVVSGLSAAIAIMAMTSSGGYAMTIIPNEGTATIRDNPTDNVPDTVFPGIFSVLDDGNNTDRAITEFDIRALTSPVSQAILSLERVGTVGVGIIIGVFGYTGDGNIELSDWLDGAFITNFDVPAAGAFDVDVTAFVNAEIAMSSGFVGFNLRAPARSDTDIQFGPTLGAQSPTLTIDNVQVLPEPGTLAVLGLGLLGLGFMGRRRRC